MVFMTMICVTSFFHFLLMVKNLCPQRWLDQLPGEPDRDSSWRQDGGRLSHSSGSAD